MSLPHCKSFPDHTRPVVAPAQPTDHVTATYLPTMTCEQGYTTWGILLNKSTKRPLDGMHLLPSTALAFADAVEATGAECVGQEVCVIVHTAGQKFVQFAAVPASDCARLAADIRTAYAQHA